HRLSTMMALISAILERLPSLCETNHPLSWRRRMTLEGDAVETAGARLARRVRELRRERHWTLDKLSLACGVSRSMLSQIERGQANPTLAVTFAIARAFG